MPGAINDNVLSAESDLSWNWPSSLPKPYSFTLPCSHYLIGATANNPHHVKERPSSRHRLLRSLRGGWSLIRRIQARCTQMSRGAFCPCIKGPDCGVRPGAKALSN